MESRDKALKVAVTAVALMAAAMFTYYWVHGRTRTTENDVNFSEKVEAGAKEEKSEFAGVYSSTESIEGLNHRLAFFSLNQKEGGGGYFGTAKVDAIGAEVESSTFLKCNDVNISDKDFFVKCNDPEMGQISFVGEWQKNSVGAIQVNGKIHWTKDVTEISDKATTLTRTGL